MSIEGSALTGALKLRGDCSVRIEGMGFSADDIAACASNQGLLSIELELTGESTCDCPACAEKPQSVLSPSEMLGLVDQAKDLGCRRVILIDETAPRDTGLRPVQATSEVQSSSTPDASSTGRRPVSQERLFNLVDEIKQRQLQIELITNDPAITPELAATLFAADVDVAVNYESFATIDRLIKAGYTGPASPKLSARLLTTKSNLHLIPAIWQSLRSTGVVPHVQIATPDQNGRAPRSSQIQAGSVFDPEAQTRREGTPEGLDSGATRSGPSLVPSDPASMPNPTEIRQLFEELSRIDRAQFNITWPNPPELTGRSCKRHLFAVHLSSCGTVYACRGIGIPLGNIRVEPLREIITLSEVLEDIRAYHQKTKEPCRTCSKTVDCYGCRGSAYQRTGDYLAGDSACWKADGVPIQILPVNVAGLIPHGPSIRMVDQLVRVRERQFTTNFSVPVDSPFLDGHGTLDELAYIEMIAQSFAASHCFHLTPEQLAAHKGLLLGITNLIITGSARGGDKLTIELKKVTRFGDFGIVEGQVHQADGSMIASGQVKVWRPAEATLPT